MKDEVREIGNKTEEGRLKIEKIEKYEKEAESLRDEALGAAGSATIFAVFGMLLSGGIWHPSTPFLLRIASLIATFVAAGCSVRDIKEMTSLKCDEKIANYKASLLEDEILASEEVKVK